MKDKTPKRPVHIPKEAIWDAQMECWRLGESMTSLERYWNKEGGLYHENHRDDNGTGWTKRYHPDGTIASYYKYKHHLEDGPTVFQRSKKPSPEFFPAGPHATVWKVEVVFKQAHIIRAKYFMEDGTEVPCYGIGEPDEALETLLLKSPGDLLYGMMRNIDDK